MNAYESTIKSALEHLEDNPGQSLRSVAVAYDISEATLRRRRGGGRNRRVSHTQEQRLSPVQEEFLVDWILEQDQHGYPPSHARAREMASRVLALNGDTAPLGYRWTERFIVRNPRVASVIGRKVETIRITGTTQEAMQALYDTWPEN